MNNSTPRKGVILKNMQYSSNSPYIGRLNARWILSIILIVVWVFSFTNSPNFGFSSAGGILALGFNFMHVVLLPGLAVLFFFIGRNDKNSPNK